VANESGSKVVAVRIEPTSVCQRGDLDALEAAVRISNAPIMASLEPLSGGSLSSSSAATKTVSISELRQGLTLSLPGGSPTAQPFGLYICSDIDRQGHCRGKPPAPLAYGVSALEASLQKNSRQDYVYYFQFLLMDTNRFLVYQAAYDGPKINGAMAQAGQTRPEEIKAASKESFELLKVLKPVPVSPITNPETGTTLHLQLPYFDPSACGR